MSYDPTSYELNDDRPLPIIFIHAELDDADLDPYEFRIYAHLSRRAGRKQFAWPSIEAIGKHCKIGSTKVKDSLEVLQKRGMIIMQKTEGFSTKYTIKDKQFWVNSCSKTTPDTQSPGVYPPVARRLPTQSPGVYEVTKGEITKGNSGTADAAQVFPPELDRPDFKAVWQDWLLYRKERKQPKLLARSIAAKFAEIVSWGGAAAGIEAIRYSIANGYLGIFKPKSKPEFNSRNRPLTGLEQLQSELLKVGGDVLGQPEESERRRRKRADLVAKIEALKLQPV